MSSYHWNRFILSISYWKFSLPLHGWMEVLIMIFRHLQIIVRISLHRCLHRNAVAFLQSVNASRIVCYFRWKTIICSHDWNVIENGKFVHLKRQNNNTVYQVVNEKNWAPREFPIEMELARISFDNSARMMMSEFFLDRWWDSIQILWSLLFS